MVTNANNTLCCPRFDPQPWDKKEIIWEDKLFLRDTVAQFLHMPLPGVFQKTVARMWKKIEEAKASPDMKDFLMLSYDPSPWKSELYINITGEVPNADNIRLFGTYLTRVFDGPYNSPPRWIKEMNAYVTGQNKVVKKYYFYFTTCPKCAKIYGHNYAVIFAEV